MHRKNADAPEHNKEPFEDLEDSRIKQFELHNILTSLYILVEVARWQSENEEYPQWRDEISSTDPNLLLLLTQIVSKLRWEDPSEPTIFPRNRVFLLLWKTLLLVFGNLKDVLDSKEVLRKEQNLSDGEHDESFITASPLDYHLFRQEITSKYPAYSPPQPLVPIELENNSILPPLPNHTSRQTSQESLHHSVGHNPPSKSIFNQPVHIATPAPSPPPSPAGPGGKSGKKQNYQTNQNFPFLYPPPSDSKDADIRNGNKLQFRRVQDTKWDDSDVPASILEAGSLFASRMRMSRSLKQLWDVREEYIKAERGWNESDVDDGATSDPESMDEEEVERLYLEERKKAALNDSEQGKQDGGREEEPQSFHTQGHPEVDMRMVETDDKDVQRRLDAVSSFYVSELHLLLYEKLISVQHNALPDLQSFVIVLFKELFQNVQSLINQNGPNGAPNGISEDAVNDGPNKRRTNPNSSANLNAMVNGHLTEDDDGTTPAIETLNDLRSREVSSKAVSGILLVLLKWFKLSRKTSVPQPFLSSELTIYQTFSNSNISPSSFSTPIFSPSFSNSLPTKMSTRLSNPPTTAKISTSSPSATSIPNIPPSHWQQRPQLLAPPPSPPPLPAPPTTLHHPQSPNTAAPPPYALPLQPRLPHLPAPKSTNSAFQQRAPSPQRPSQTSPRDSSSPTSTSCASSKKSPSAKLTAPCSSCNTSPQLSCVNR